MTRAVIRVLICDDSEAIARLVELWLEAEPDLQPLGPCRSASDARRCTHALAPDVVLLDLQLAGTLDIEGACALIGELPSPVVVFSGYDADRHAAQCRQAGAVAYVEKSADPGELLAAIRAAAA